MAKVLRISEERWRKFEAAAAEITLTQVGKLAKHFSIDESALRQFLSGRHPDAAVPA